ncbi:DegV family protein [Sporanaerobacter sp. PP17-6a]|uniref:DegV family protein n=1 Tax=Sporanaerobacter sp. PP17-6a TaxID=1891289 RepID=UPI00089FC243|nr:DegV family protein [Sporanaerobacter sp. PP17-6a]SCL93019.1 Fatty acid-binding protein [Sporanaerobacter sp. PP17-6a]
MSEAIVITSDSACDLSEDLVDKYNVKIIPLHVSIGDKDYKDCVDLMPDDIYGIYDKTGLLPKTSATNVLEYVKFFKQFTAKGCSVIHISLSSQVSCVYQNATLAASELSNVYVLDSLNLSTGIGLLVIKACEMRDSGLTASDIVKNLEKLIPCVNTSFVVDSLEFLHKGGRCSSITVVGANILHIKPCIEVLEGNMRLVKKYRGKLKNAIYNYVQERLKTTTDIDYSRIFITHSGVDGDIIEMVKNIIKENFIFKEILVTRAGCAVTSHCGPNTLGILFVKDIKDN